jgi:rubrerythrin
MTELVYSPNDEAVANCESCGGGPVVLRRHTVDDQSAGQPFLGPSEAIDVWTCRACGFEHNDNFAPGGRRIKKR